MNNLPQSYRIDESLCWERFSVRTDFDDSYIRLNFNDMEYMSDGFITYLPGGGNMTVDMGRKRRLALLINRNGHTSYPTIAPGDGYLFTIYNDDLGIIQAGTKPLRLVAANENYLVFRGYPVVEMSVFGLVDPGNTDYGVAIFLQDRSIRKIACYRYDTQKCYEYANTSNQMQQLSINLPIDEGVPIVNSVIEDPTDIRFEEVRLHGFGG